jgi:hypothetical protein
MPQRNWYLPNGATKGVAMRSSAFLNPNGIYIYRINTPTKSGRLLYSSFQILLNSSSVIIFDGSKYASLSI